MIPSNSRIEILSICALLCAIGSKGLSLIRCNVLQKISRYFFRIQTLCTILSLKLIEFQVKIAQKIISMPSNIYIAINIQKIISS